LSNDLIKHITGKSFPSALQWCFTKFHPTKSYSKQLASKLACPEIGAHNWLVDGYRGIVATWAVFDGVLHVHAKVHDIGFLKLCLTPIWLKC
jgi:hypothetical protein